MNTVNIGDMVRITVDYGAILKHEYPSFDENSAPPKDAVGRVVSVQPEAIEVEFVGYANTWYFISGEYGEVES